MRPARDPQGRPARARGLRVRDGQHPAGDHHRVRAVSRRAAAGRLEDAGGAQRNVDRRLGESGCGEASRSACPENLLPPVLLADALVLLDVGAGAVVERLVRAALQSLDARGQRDRIRSCTAPTTEPADPGGILLWLGLALLVGLGAARLAASLPVSMMLTTTSWTVLIATLAGLIVARTPLARIPGPAPLASALLAMLVAVLASQSNFAGHGVRAAVHPVRPARRSLIHIALLALAARAFRFDLQLCGISSLAQIGGVASAPVLAATYTPILVPIAVLLAHARPRSSAPASDCSWRAYCRHWRHETFDPHRSRSFVARSVRTPRRANRRFPRMPSSA